VDIDRALRIATLIAVLLLPLGLRNLNQPQQEQSQPTYEYKVEIFQLNHDGMIVAPRDWEPIQHINTLGPDTVSCLARRRTN
jgi:hypothetical protein